MLVSYSESEEEEAKAPGLPQQFQSKLPNDNPAQHQGRTRSKPFVEGAYSTHVYLSVPFEYSLQRILNDIYQHFTHKYDNMHPLFPQDTDADKECYISLSRPLSLRHHQLKSFSSDVRSISKYHKPITISFSDLSVLYNDNKTRAFVVIPVVAGYMELRRLVTELDNGPVDAHHQEKYYDPPIFHTSIGWLLTAGAFDEKVFEDDVKKANEMFQRRLRLLGALTCSVVNVKIAKNVHSYELSG